MSTTAAHRHRVLGRWPAALGLAAAAGYLLSGVDRDTIATVLTVALLCYLAAAAFGLPWLAWATIPGGILVAVAGGLLGVEPWISLGVVAALLVVVGLLGGASRSALAAQAAAMLAYGSVATVGLFVAPVAGLVLAASALIAHGVWDVIHYRRDAVVPRSLAEFCVWLDVPLDVGALVLARPARRAGTSRSCPRGRAPGRAPARTCPTSRVSAAAEAPGHDHRVQATSAISPPAEAAGCAAVPILARQPVRSHRHDRRWTLLVATPGLCDRCLDTVDR